jgi:hypothetical protein
MYSSKSGNTHHTVALSSSALPFIRESDESFSSSVTDLSKRGHHLQGRCFTFPSHLSHGNFTFEIPMWL